MDLERAWEAVLGEFELTLSRANYTTWFKNTSLLDYDEKKATVTVPSAFVKEWIQDKYHIEIEEALAKVIGHKLKVSYQVKSPTEVKEIKLDTEIKARGESDTEAQHLSSLNPKYTFDCFVIGGSNRFAQAACLGVAKDPGKKYNPLFIYGGVGLGKTHLVQAVGNEILKNHPNKKVLYTPSERFVNDFIEALRSSGANGFKNKYRSIDVLIIDDIQFLAGKESTQEEFFHTFNSLYQNNKQIILSSDRPPQALNTLQERIKSRFEGGMIADIQSPDLETRIAIIQEKCREHSFKSSSDVVEFIAKSIKHNVRELGKKKTNCINLMLERKFRLTGKKEITKTFKGKSARGSFFNIKAIGNKFGKTRIAIIVGKKVSMKSTERNLIKRRVSESIKDKLGLVKGFDITINALPEVQKANFKDIDTDIKKLFEKINKR